jgi:hypothetical protein
MTILGTIGESLGLVAEAPAYSPDIVDSVMATTMAAAAAVDRAPTTSSKQEMA